MGNASEMSKPFTKTKVYRNQKRNEKQKQSKARQSNDRPTYRPTRPKEKPNTNAVDTYTVGNEVEKMSASAHTHTYTYMCTQKIERKCIHRRKPKKKRFRSLKMRNNDTQRDRATECQNSKNMRTSDRRTLEWEIKKEKEAGGRASERVHTHKILKRCYRTDRQYGVEMNGYCAK